MEDIKKRNKYESVRSEESIGFGCNCEDKRGQRELQVSVNL